MTQVILYLMNHMFMMRFFNCAFEVPSVALDDDGEYKSHFEKPYRNNSKTSSGRGQSSNCRGATRG